MEGSSQLDAVAALTQGEKILDAPLAVRLCELRRRSELWLREKSHYPALTGALDCALQATHCHLTCDINRKLET